MSSSFVIPRKLEAKLKGSSWYGPLLKTLASFEWLPSRSLDLFPDFTDHGPNHLNDVLRMAERLIHSKSWNKLSAEDTAVLILGVLLHDLGMHITTDAFSSLCRGETGHKPIEGFDTESWPGLWTDYCYAAARFSARENMDLFGTDPVHPPSLASPNWTENERRFAGEFLRRHHARLAHGIAIYGFPGRTGAEPIMLDPGLKPLADLSGLVARSHALDLRECVTYLIERYNNQSVPKNTHAVFLMTVLRIADFLQYQPDRAPELRLRVQNLRSPISKREWRKHIFEVSDHPDPEAFHINLEPADVETYLGVKKLLVDFQHELDHSWAVLGEVYSGKNLLLAKRRVRSNLDAKNWRPLGYLPLRARFEATDAQLLSLLVEPLYDYNPSYGVRELIQNAVDAVRERAALGNYTGPELQDGCDVLLTLSASALTVDDCGIGMTADTIVNYFLRAGASFRNSAFWRRNFISDSGETTTLRAGRFGLGALASFLLGTRIKVSSRHCSEDCGIEFEATIDADPIELRPCDRPIGTTVTIELKDDVHYKLQADFRAFDWYAFDWPRISILRDDSAKDSLSRPCLPASWDVEAPGWVPVRLTGSVRIKWRREGGNRNILNGFYLQSDTGEFHTGATYGEVSCSTSWWDPNGEIDVDLMRTQVQPQKATDELLRSFVRNWIGSALAAKDLLEPWFVIEPPAQPQPCFWAHTEQGVVLFDMELFRRLGIVEALMNSYPDPDPFRHMNVIKLPPFSWPTRIASGKYDKGYSRANRKPSSRFAALAPLAKQKGEMDATGLFECYPPQPLPLSEPTWITSAWLDIIGEICIPYERAARRKLCARAYRLLREEIRFWEKRFKKR
jgi:hypothetical protein